MRKLAIYGTVIFGIVFGLAFISCGLNLIFIPDRAKGMTITIWIPSLVISVLILTFCSLYLYQETRKTEQFNKILRVLAPINILVSGLITIRGIYDIIFVHKHGVVFIVITLVIFIPMLILCNRYLWNEVTKKVMNRPSIRLEREIEGFQLDAKIDMFENDPAWKEIKEPMKRMFESGLSAESNEKLFRSFSDNKDIMLGFVFDKLYKIGIMLPSSKMKYYLQYFNEKYGKGREDRFAYTWQDNNTKLELIKRQPNSITGETLITIFLTDRNLLKGGI